MRLKTRKTVNHSHMRRFVYFLQEISKIFLFFVLFFVWARYSFSLLWATVLSVFLSVSLWLIFFLWNKKKKSSSTLKMKEKEEAEEMFFSLCCDEKAIDFFSELAKKKHQNVVKRKAYIIVNHEDPGTKTILFPHLKLSTLTVQEFVEIYQSVKKENAGKIVIVCQQFDKTILPLLSRFSEKFLIFNQYETYEKLFKFYCFFPKFDQRISKTKTTYKDFLAFSFNKKRTKGYLLSALTLVFCSLFVKMSLFYCIVSSILVVFAIFSQFNPKFNVKETAEIL